MDDDIEMSGGSVNSAEVSENNYINWTAVLSGNFRSLIKHYRNTTCYKKDDSLLNFINFMHQVCQTNLLTFDQKNLVLDFIINRITRREPITQEEIQFLKNHFQIDSVYDNFSNLITQLNNKLDKGHMHMRAFLPDGDYRNVEDLFKQYKEALHGPPQTDQSPYTVVNNVWVMAILTRYIIVGGQLISMCLGFALKDKGISYLERFLPVVWDSARNIACSLLQTITYPSIIGVIGYGVWNSTPLVKLRNPKLVLIMNSQNEVELKKKNSQPDENTALLPN